MKEYEMLKDWPDVLTVKQMAKLLGVGVNAAYQLVNDGSIGSCRIGKSIRVPKLCIVDYLDMARYTVSTTIVADNLTAGKELL
ncbi:MAG: helix-turn-helix domain-containing protein [Oscillospiraceae bacterium]|nr:helix-turn-helix domain-containing protein [Oscillospiraceae bacterium]